MTLMYSYPIPLLTSNLRDKSSLCTYLEFPAAQITKKPKVIIRKIILDMPISVLTTLNSFRFWEYIFL